MSRRDQIAEALTRTRERIAVACADAERDPDEVTLIVVTKYFPASDVRHLVELGVTDVGENRHQEAQAKAADLADVAVRWHYVGGLQSNKAAAVARYADVVHSVDRLKLVSRLASGAADRGAQLDVLLQVSLDPQDAAGRAGAAPEHLMALAAAVNGSEQLRLRGLMAVAPLTEQPESAFARLADVRGEFVARHPEASWLSAGMSGDLEAAIAHGATHVRVGTAVLGSRPEVK
jgi:pyridoxal phosphate enzyme (YggS family)